MKKLENLKYILKVIFSPSHWLLNYDVSKEWDYTLNSLLKNCSFIPVSSHEAMLGRYRVWIQNYPNACFTITVRGHNLSPKRTTIIKAREKFLEDMKRYPKCNCRKNNFMYWNHIDGCYVCDLCESTCHVD